MIRLHRVGWMLAVIALLFITSQAISALPQSDFENNLAQHLALTGESELVPVFIGIRNPYPLQELLEDVQGMPLPQRRQLVIETLRDHFDQQASELSAWLRAEVAKGNATQLHSVWLAHGFIVKLRADLIPVLAEMDEVARLRYDPPIPFESVNDEIDPDSPEWFSSELDETSWAAPMIGAEELWGLGYEGEGVLVAVIDSGVYYEHNDLINNVWTNEDEIPDNGIDDDLNGYIDDIHGWNFYSDNNDISDIQGHGTKCSGAVLGDGTDGTLTGMAPAASLMVIRNYSSGWVSEGTRAAAVQYAITNGADVITCSMSYKRNEPYIPDYVTHRYTYLAQLASGTISVNSTGNSNTAPVPWNIAAPANCPAPFLHPDQTLRGGVTAVMAIGAHNSAGFLETFTGDGPASWEEEEYPGVFQDYPWDNGESMGLMKPDILAPSGVPTTTRTGGYTTFSGTSASTPIAAGGLALLRQIHPQVSPELLAEGIVMTAIDGGDPGFDNQWGSGRIQIQDAHQYLDNLVDYGSLDVVIETSVGTPDSFIVIVGEDEIRKVFYDMEFGPIERVFPGTYDVVVELPGNDQRYFSNVVIETDQTTELIVEADFTTFSVSPDDINETTYTPDVQLEFEIDHGNSEPIELDVRAIPFGGLDWEVDQEMDLETDIVHCLLMTNGRIVAGGLTGNTPMFWRYDLEDQTYVSNWQPPRFGLTGVESISWKAQGYNYVMLYEDKIFHTELDHSLELTFVDSLTLPPEITEPVGLAYQPDGFPYLFVADNVSRLLYRLDPVDGTILNTYDINGIRAKSLSFAEGYGDQPADRLIILAEDLTGSTYLAEYDYVADEIEVQPLLRQLVGYDPVCAGAGTRSHGFEFGQVFADENGLLRFYARGFIPDLVYDLSDEIIPVGGGQMTVFIDGFQFINNQTHRFNLYFEELGGGFSQSASITLYVDWSDVSESGSSSELPDTPQLERVYPNPFNASVTLQYALPSPGQVKLTVFDILGREVVKLEDAHRMAGSHTITWTPGQTASGIYFAVLEAGDSRTARKLLLMK